MADREEGDGVLSETTVSNISYSVGLALISALAVAIGQAIDIAEHNRPMLAALDPGVVGISVLVGIVSFFAGWIASALTNVLEDQLAFRIVILTFAAPLGLLLILTMIVSVLAGGAAGSGVFVVSMRLVALPGLIASAAWSTIFLTWRRRRRRS